MQEKNALVLEELWKAEEDLNYSIRSEEYHNQLLVLEMGAKKPEIGFDNTLRSTGIETIEKARRRLDM